MLFKYRTSIYLFLSQKCMNRFVKIAVLVFLSPQFRNQSLTIRYHDVENREGKNSNSGSKTHK